MTTLRLTHEMEEALKIISEQEERSKSDIIKQALTEFLDRCSNSKSAYDIGRDLFGLHGSGQKNLSRDYKKLLKEKLHAKHAH